MKGLSIAITIPLAVLVGLLLALMTAMIIRRSLLRDVTLFASGPCDAKSEGSDVEGPAFVPTNMQAPTSLKPAGSARCAKCLASSSAGLVLAILLMFVFCGPASGQISPGPLSKAHRSLDSATQCANCHKFGGGAAILKCLDCHTEIAERLSSRRGLHATYGVPAGSSQGCEGCHSEHNGREFPLVKFDTKSFDHKRTGYALEGKHAALTCNRCHTPERLVPAQRQSIKVHDLSRTYLGLTSACGSCHKDPHDGRLGPNCAQCHNSTDWKNTAGQFDHAKTRFPLTGLHVQVKCQQCHAAGPDGQARYRGLPFSRCSDCHADPHKGSFAPQTCQSCHNTEGWKRVSTFSLRQNFDHTKTKYPLLGKHQQVACGSCHRKGDFKQPLAFQRCMDCHRDEHQGQFAKRPGGGECAECHTVEGYKPAKFGRKEHQASAYPLQGKHAALECGQCHVPHGKETLYKIKFERCLDCHQDEHKAQFAAAPYLNRCEQCHTLDGYRPSTFGLARHKQSRFILTGSHLAVTCQECHKPPAATSTARQSVPYHFENLSCITCHEDPHKGQFRERMQRVINGRAPGCEACHVTKTWKDLSSFDHAQTDFPLVGSHRAVACIDCHKPPNLETKLVHVDFHSAPKQCEECHADTHGAQFAKGGTTTCVECHNTGRWKPSIFDHDKTSFSLVGAHGAVRCAECHKLTRPVGGKSVLFYKPTPKDCTACHGAHVPVVKNTKS